MVATAATGTDHTVTADLVPRRIGRGTAEEAAVTGTLGNNSRISNIVTTVTTRTTRTATVESTTATFPPPDGATPQAQTTEITGPPASRDGTATTAAAAGRGREAAGATTTGTGNTETTNGDGDFTCDMR